MDENTEFRRLLDSYKENYSRFMTTGSQQYKDAYGQYLSQANAIIEAKRVRYENEKSLMGSFLSDYQERQGSIDNIYSDSQSFYGKVDKVESDYTAAKERYDAMVGGGKIPPTPVPFLQRGYDIMLRIGILFLIIVFFFLGAYYFQGAAPEVPVAQQLLQRATDAFVQAVTPRLTPLQGPIRR